MAKLTGKLKPDWAQHAIPQSVAAAWMGCGGDHHGPRVETVTMPMANLMKFVSAVRDLPLSREADA